MTSHRGSRLCIRLLVVPPDAAGQQQAAWPRRCGPQRYATARLPDVVNAAGAVISSHQDIVCHDFVPACSLCAALTVGSSVARGQIATACDGHVQPETPAAALTNVQGVAEVRRSALCAPSGSVQHLGEGCPGAKFRNTNAAATVSHTCALACFCRCTEDRASICTSQNPRTPASYIAGLLNADRCTSADHTESISMAMSQPVAPLQDENDVAHGHRVKFDASAGGMSFTGGKGLGGLWAGGGLKTPGKGLSSSRKALGNITNTAGGIATQNSMQLQSLRTNSDCSVLGPLLCSPGISSRCRTSQTLRPSAVMI